MTDDHSSSGYWYDEHRRATSVDVLNLMRQYRQAEADMRRRTRDSMGMGETDLLALRYLLKAEKEGRVMTARDLSALLRISSASTTALVDRLERGHHIARAPHPTDRRMQVIVPTVETDAEVRQTLGRMHQRMVQITDELVEDELAVVARFLSGMIHAVSDTEDLDQELRDVVRQMNDGEDAGDPTAR
ncbi:MarR family winged helix-turn-helix transcriptional regulator [Schumannella sp. 10F1B-5-1]|uniref:MarR family winged helix-turn-helix transcriptional regulator n=1 Tax=Schumannella sp. 10F1B-5-1 TaxID=2590780 RepID=UPI0011315A5C|nr:MarR family transcriptional regulator [Schumannella sp. 10F1B-5-1]TPW78342.1 MarR family transcriptional regulator [Schumannella sp. 10F1B-5-1]